MAGLVGDRKRAKERLEAEGKMDMSAEILTARAAYFEALDTGEDVRAARTSSRARLLLPTMRSRGADARRVRAQMFNKKFTYAWCLVHLTTREDISSGISLLKVCAGHCGPADAPVAATLTVLAMPAAAAWAGADGAQGRPAGGLLLLGDCAV
jgi:hypothetical protein